MRTPLSLTVATTAGPVRDRNEDAVGLDGWQLTPGDSGVLRMLLDPTVSHGIVLADGLGGHAGGAEASAVVVRMMSMPIGGPRVAEHLTTLAHRTHARLTDVGEAEPQLRGLGSTAGALALEPDGQLTVLSIGDTLALHLIDGVLGSLNQPQRVGTALRQCLGGGAKNPPTPELRSLHAIPGARYLLCTDGVWEALPTDRLEQLASAATPESACAAVLAEVERRGGSDNATIVVLDIPGGNRG